ncbi:MAG: RagB/SusD family nutrient uptake outer membrane protein [Flavobacteriaceae bacterium]|nr:RagB/SusD family nutrient uptake outer membrane protein [Flavobacteriaceae bacterium]
MKKIINIFAICGILFGITSCETDFDNINQAAEDKVLTTKEGLMGVAVGMTEHYATSTLAPVVEVPGLSTRELGNLLTFVTPAELVLGGQALNSDNAGITRLWDRLLRDKGMAESIIDNIDAIEMEPGTKSGLKSYARWFKALTLGNLIQNFEQAPINNDADGQAIFSDRTAVLNECIQLLNDAKADLASIPASDEVNNLLSTISLENVINALLARYNLYAGNPDDAIAAADAVDLTVKSVWPYDGTTTKNPVWNFAFFNNPDTKPQDNFGLTGDYVPEAVDGRIAFYLTPSTDKESEFGEHEVEDLAGFFNDPAKSIPVYLPGEMLLIKAEAYAMKDELPNAVIQLNLVRQKTDDVFGVNAALGAWTGDETSKTAVMNEIFRNRAIELFMTGQRFEDSRRIHPDLSIPTAGDYFIERNRNYYPYPFNERENNKNTPNDPNI